MKNIKVLFADDDYLVCDTIEHCIAKEGWVPIIAHNGKEACDRYLEMQPDIVVLDYAMPVQSGVEVAKMIRILNATTPIIFYTGVATEKVLKNIFSIGINMTLMKEFAPSLLVEMVRNVIMQNIFSGNITLANNVMLCTNINTLNVNSVSYKLSPQLAIILGELAKSMNSVVEYDRLCSKVWGGEVLDDTHRADLRKRVSELNKLLKVNTKLVIRNVRGAGYVLNNVEL